MLTEYDELITIEELCNILSIGKNSAYTLLKNRSIKAFRIGRNWKIPKEAVQEFILRQSGLDI